MSKNNINIKLTFSSDTKAAQQQLNQLQQTLSNIAATPITGSGLRASSKEIQMATNKAVELKVALHNATNVNTGKLNFNKFSQELKRNKTSLQQYAAQLQKLGPQGVQAFSQLATSIRQSETPLVSMQGKLAALGQTFMNTVKWSISSSMIQGVTRAFTSTIDYAKELNESLNNIRIVTGKSVEDVTKFANEANKAAKSLSATTSEYAKASLIYFQQGLNDSEVAERTATTLKLSKVVGESAETTSEWMTAIWNNFDDGSRSLETYADVLAKLGAATASSADEIAGGLEKFAAVAETVGLSYEYAASALATITAETRQSEEVVGTALKTIFARVENLSLGKTLDDGTTLGKYSEALSKVGVSIKDNNNNLKDMDIILNDIGTQWQILNRDQQVALAQSVAGIRQYSQFMALMDNWDVMKENVEMAKEANGALENQHEIWESGIEGATSRVKEELNEIKNNLLGENDLLPLLNIAEGFLGFIADLVDNMGGLKGLLTAIAAIGLKVWGPQVAAGMTSVISGIKSLYGGIIGSAQAEKSSMSTEAANIAKKMHDNVGTTGASGEAQGKILEKEAELTKKFEEAQKNISKENLEQINQLRQLLELQEKLVVKKAEEYEASQNNTDNIQKKMLAHNVSLDEMATLENSLYLNDNADKMAGTTITTDEAGIGDSGQIGQIGAEAENLLKGVEAGGGIGVDPEKLEEVRAKYGEVTKAIGNYESASEKLVKLEDELATCTDKSGKEQQRLKGEIDGVKKSMASSTKALDKAKNEMATSVKETNKFENSIGDLSKAHEGAEDTIGEYGASLVQTKKKQQEFADSQEDLKEGYQNVGDVIDDANAKGQGWTTSVVNGIQGVASAAAGLQMLVGSFDSLTTSLAEGEFGFSEFLSTLTSVGFAIPMLIPLFKALGNVIHFDTIKTKIATSMKKALEKAEKKRADKAMGNAVKVKAANEVEQSSDKASMITKLGKWMASGPWGWAIAAIAIAAIAGLGLAINASVQNKRVEKQKEEQREEDIGTADESIEASEGWKEEAKSMDEVIAKYKELKEAAKATAGGQKEFADAQKAVIDQVPKLIEKYNEVDKANDNLDLSQQVRNLEAAAASNDAEQVEKITNEIDNMVNSATKENIQTGAIASMDKALEGMGGSNKAGQNSIEIDTYDQEFADWMNIQEDQIKRDADGYAIGFSLEFDNENPRAFVEQYENLQEYVKAMEEAGTTSGAAYKKIKTMLSESQEAFEKTKELVDSGTAYELQDIFSGLDVKNTEGMKIDPSAIQSYEDYIKVKEQLMEQAKAQGIAEEEVKSWLKAQGAVSEYVALEEKALNQANKYGKKIKEDIENYAKDLTKEELKAFLKIDFDKNQAKETWDDLIRFYQEQEKSETYKKDAAGIASGLKNLKSNGTREDYEKLQNDISWGQNGVMQYSEFMSKSFEEQQMYLQTLQTNLNQFEVDHLQQGLRELQNAEKELMDQGEAADEVALFNTRQMIEQQKIQIALAKKQAEAAEKALKRQEKERKQALKDMVREVDIYKELDDVADDLSRTMNNLASAKEYAYGAERLAIIEAEGKAIEKENKLLDAQIATAKEKIALNKQELQSKYGAKFDKNGNITNYTETTISLQNKKADALIKYGKDSDEYKDADQELKNFENAAKDYEDSLKRAEEATDQKAENMRKKLDKELEGIQYSVDVKIDINDTELKRLQYLAKSFDDPLYDGADKVKNAQKQAKAYEGNIKAAESGIDKTLKNAGASNEQIAAYKAGDASAISGLKLSSKEIEALEGYSDTILENQENLEELNETVRDSLMETFNAWQDKMEEVGATFDTLGGIVGNFQNIIDTVGEGILGISEEQRKEMEQMSLDAANGRLATNKAKMEFTQSSLKTVNDTISDMEKSGKKTMKDSEGKEQTLEWWKEQQATLNQQLLTDQEAFTSSWADALQVAADIFQAQMDRAFDDMDDKLAGTYGSLAELQTAFDQDQDIMNRYLDGGEKLYELSKLNRQIQKDIDKSTNTKAQRELAELQEIIKAYQADGVEMSKYELDALQKKYDLKVAEIALEESQNAKSQVRLQRDSQGNFNYVYTADEDKTADAAQKYEDELEANRRLAEEQSTELTQQIIQNRQAMVDALREINASDYATTEEYLKAIDEKKQFYTDKESYLVNEYNKTIGRSQLIYAEDFASYDGWSGKKMDKAKLLAETLGDAETEMGQNTSGFVEAYSQAMEAMGLAMDLPEVSAKDLMDALGDGASQDGDGYYNSTLARTAAWASGMYGQSENAAASFSLLIGKDGDKKGGGICGVIASVGDNTTGYYGDALNKTSTFIGEIGKDGTFTGYMEKGGKSFDLIDTGASDLLTKMGVGTKEGGGKFGTILTYGDSFASNLNTTIGGVDFTPVSTNADTLKTTLGTYDDPKTPLGGIYSNVDTWQTNVDDVMGNAGTSIKDFGKDAKTFLFGEGGSYKKPTGGVAKTLSDSEDTLGDYAEAANEAFTLNATEQANWNKTQQKIVDNKDKIDNLYTSLKDLKEDYTGNNAPDIDIDVQIPNHQELKDLIEEMKQITDKEVTITTNYKQNGSANGGYDGLGKNKFYVASMKKSEDRTYYKTSAGWYSAGDVGGVSYNSSTGVLSVGSNTVSYTDAEMDKLIRANDSKYANSDSPGLEIKHKSGIVPVYNASTGAITNYNFKDVWHYPNIEKTTKFRLIDGQLCLYVKENEYNISGYIPIKYLGTTGDNSDDTLSFDTGGYTGEWGSDGRMAILHQKEIILNAHDTENFLKAIEIVRSISTRLDQQASIMSMGLSNVFANVVAPKEKSDILQQEVHIIAEFPNATNHNEIEEAFNNLINNSAQYANHK